MSTNPANPVNLMRSVQTDSVGNHVQTNTAREVAAEDRSAGFVPFRLHMTTATPDFPLFSFSPSRVCTVPTIGGLTSNNGTDVWILLAPPLSTARVSIDCFLLLRRRAHGTPCHQMQSHETRRSHEPRCRTQTHAPIATQQTHARRCINSPIFGLHFRACRICAPGDLTRMHSILTAALLRRPNRRSNNNQSNSTQAQRTRDTDPAQSLLTVEEMANPIPSSISGGRVVQKWPTGFKSQRVGSRRLKSNAVIVGQPPKGTAVQYCIDCKMVSTSFAHLTLDQSDRVSVAHWARCVVGRDVITGPWYWNSGVYAALLVTALTVSGSVSLL
ncbi:hypothetical protein C8R43DRAFT_957547 [Mycena crocata]|nr:hypothetical protein C8R43DRAFT_957547 [Mycena crocata]